MSNDNPHANDHCVVCDNTPRVDGPQMYPVVGISDGCVCGRCVRASATRSDGDRVVILGDRYSDTEQNQ